jgi:hypothetical protein
VLSLDVTEVLAASRLVQTDSTFTPTEFISQTQYPSSDEDTTDAPTMSPTMPLTYPPKNENGLAIILSSLFLGICIVVAGLLVYWNSHRTVGNNVRHRKRRSTDEINDDDMETAGAANSNAVRIQEPTPSSSSTSSKDDCGASGGGDDDKERGHHHNKDDDDGDDNPTCGEHYDDWVHHYFKTKNEKKERKKKRATSSSSADPATGMSKIRTSSSYLQDPERRNDHVRSDSTVSVSSMNTSLQKLEEQREVLSEQEYEDRRREILLAALQ